MTANKFLVWPCCQVIFWRDVVIWRSDPNFDTIILFILQLLLILPVVYTVYIHYSIYQHCFNVIYRPGLFHFCKCWIYELLHTFHGYSNIFLFGAKLRKGKLDKNYLKDKAFFLDEASLLWYQKSSNILFCGRKLRSVTVPTHIFLWDCGP